MEDKIKSDLKQAQLSRDETKISTLRLLLSEIKNKEIAQGNILSDEDIIFVVQREAKKRKEAAAAFKLGNRKDAAEREEAELKVLEGYLPQQLSNEELTKIVEESITELDATGIADMGKVIGMVMGKTKGQADGSAVSAIAKAKLV